MVGNPNESTVTKERGREAAPTNPKKKRDQTRLQDLEDHVLEQVDALKGSVEETNNEVEARFVQLEDMIQALRESIEGMREDLTLCKRATVSRSANITVSTPRVECLKSQGFNGTRDAKEMIYCSISLTDYKDGPSKRYTVETLERLMRPLPSPSQSSISNPTPTPIRRRIRINTQPKVGENGGRITKATETEITEGYKLKREIEIDVRAEGTTKRRKRPSFLKEDDSCAKSLTPTPSNGLMYVEAVINEKLTRDMVNTGATHNFVSKDEANRLGLKYTGSIGWLKMVIVIPMSSFSSVCILEKGSPYMIPTEDGKIEKTNDLPPIIHEVLEENKDVMLPELPNKLPPRREVNHKIELEPGAKPFTLAPYRMAPPELEEHRRQLKELIYTGKIRPSKAPYGAPVLFQKKHDGSLRMCVDYRALNKVTIKNRYPIPLIADLFDRLGGAKVYTKMDLKKGYYQVQITEGDEPKTTCITRYGSYEWLVMPFGLTNAPTMFCTLMNKLFQLYLDQLMVVYLDDIVVYSNSMEELIDHLRIVFKILRENELYVKKEKCTFATEEVHFLGHVIGHGKLLMDRNKIKAIIEWEPPIKVSEMRSFFGLVNYYRRFIQGYSARASLLMDLLKKGKAREWSEQCQKAFEDLKAAVSQEPVLALPDFTMSFEVHTDASDFAIGEVLMQEGHLIAFESHKLNDTERRYTVQEKKMTTIIHCMQVWRHYLLGAHFTIKTDNVATSYFQTHKKLSPKQARWQDFLDEFDYMLEYKPGKANVVADALSRKAELAVISLAKGTVLERIKESLKQDPMTRELVKLASDDKTQRFWAGHPGQKRTMALLETSYFWPHMKDNMELYVKTFLVCQQDKVENRQPVGLLEPLPVPQRPWDSITLDFISALPKSEGYGLIMVVVDRFSKYMTFIPCPKDCTAEEAARAFFKNVVKHWALPSSIISDRDPRFTGRLWTELFKLLGTDANQRDWANLLDVVQFSYNLQRSEATGRSPFELATGQQPLTPHTLTMLLDEGKSLGAAKMAKSWEENADIARACLEKARKKIKKWADEKRRHREFTIGDLVLVLAKVGKVSYRLDLPSTLKICPVFHVSMLKPYHADKEDPSRGYSHRASPVITKSYDKEVETVLTSRTVRKRGVPPRTEYLIKWKGLPESEVTWELAEDLWQFKEHLKACEATRMTPK
ncbi:cytochrome P450 78A7-like [Hibiscus syriacus]|uniref:Cytochrome P450 78A7-like n=1 Tax=Hibiscus syriacus TaxID=106335 RepID=A0A6A3AUP0_HIBSY|nr:cytochrome P450 78A7-like [Hibiscus syriacus]